MRIGNSSFERKSEYLDLVPKIFVMMEGTETEPLYFKELFSNMKNVEYLPFERDLTDLGWSNPLVLMNEIKLELSTEQIDLTYREFIPFLIRYLKRDNSDLDVSLFKKEFNDLLTKMRVINKNRVLDEAIVELALKQLKETAFKNLVYSGLADFKNTFTSLRDESSPYNPSTDRLILIIDRDKESFSTSQFMKVLKEAENNNVEIFITNPCFEFYLALHFSDLKDIPETDILENKKIHGITFCHNLLLGYDSTYTKGFYDTKKYLNKINTVKVNIQKYENNLTQLENKVGSNLDSLLRSIEKFKRKEEDNDES